MKSISLIKAGLLASAIILAPAYAKNTPDVPQVEAAITKGEKSLKNALKIQAGTHKNLETAIKGFKANDPATAEILIQAETADKAALKSLVEANQNLQELQKQLTAAKETYYEETPAIKEEITQGPDQSGHESEGGESITKRENESVDQQTKELKEEIKADGGNESAFAKALREQANKLKKTQDKVKKEENDASLDKQAQKDDNNLAAVLSRAIDARRKALEENDTPNDPNQWPDDKKAGSKPVRK